MRNPSDPCERIALLAPESPDATLRASGFEVCAIWEFPRGVDLALVTEAVEHRYELPDFFGKLVASADDTLTVEVTNGVARYDYRILYFLDGRGAFELITRDVRLERGAVQVRLMLRTLRTSTPPHGTSRGRWNGRAQDGRGNRP